ncbi:MAG: class I SAM-dependent methyltransferase [Chloroflexota bacterium]
MQANARDTIALYDDFSQDYDRFVDWGARLAFELPFVQARLREHGAQRVLDVACGTGQHALALARAGYAVTAADLSGAMVARARANAAAAQVPLDVRQLGFGELAHGLGAQAALFDAILCLGNSLPHVLTEDNLLATLSDMAAVLRPGGLLILQQRNWDRVLARRERFVPPQTHQSSDGEWLFMRFYDWDSPTLQFNVVRLHRQGDGAWSAAVGRTALRPWRRAELTCQLAMSSLELEGTHGSLGGEPFDLDASPDLVLVGRTAAP